MFVRYINVKFELWYFSANHSSKQRRLDFRSAKQTLVLIHFMVNSFEKFLSTDINWDNRE